MHVKTTHKAELQTLQHQTKQEIKKNVFKTCDYRKALHLKTKEAAKLKFETPAAAEKRSAHSMNACFLFFLFFSETKYSQRNHLAKLNMKKKNNTTIKDHNENIVSLCSE